MEDPIFYWLPSIAPSGFEFVTSEEFPDLKGNLLVGSLKFQYLELLRLDGKNRKTGKTTGRYWQGTQCEAGTGWKYLCCGRRKRNIQTQK